MSRHGLFNVLLFEAYIVGGWCGVSKNIEEEYKEHLEWRDEMLRTILQKLIKIEEKLDSVFSDK